MDAWGWDQLAREGVSLNVIQRQLGHANLGTTSIYLQGIDTEEIVATVHAWRVLDVADALGDELHRASVGERHDRCQIGDSAVDPRPSARRSYGQPTPGVGAGAVST
jgi:hypothetical protein